MTIPLEIATDRQGHILHARDAAWASAAAPARSVTLITQLTRTLLHAHAYEYKLFRKVVMICKPDSVDLFVSKYVF
eukprot:2461957-Pleurochrysis_carterae.AAC.1